MAGLASAPMSSLRASRPRVRIVRGGALGGGAVATCLAASALICIPVCAGLLGEAFAKTDLYALLPRARQLPGFGVASTQFEAASTAHQYALRFLHKSGAEFSGTVRRLGEGGFVEAVRESFGVPGAGGVAVVAMYRSADGAEGERAISAREELVARPSVARFRDRAVPSAEGFSARTIHPLGVYANLLLASGRCFIIVGDGIRGEPGDQVVTRAPISAITSVYGRLRRRCS